MYQAAETTKAFNKCEINLKRIKLRWERDVNENSCDQIRRRRTRTMKEK